MGRFRRWYIEHPDEAFVIFAGIAVLLVFFGLPRLMSE